MKSLSRYKNILLLTAVLLPVYGFAADTFDDSQVLHIEYPDWFVQTPFYDLQETLSDAADRNKKGLMVLFTTEGCSYCDIFIRKSLGDPAIAATLQKHFDSVGMEIFNDNHLTGPRGESMPVKEFAKREGVEYSPTLLFYSVDGARVLRVVGYQSPERFRMILDYVAGDYYDTVSLRNYLKARTRPEPGTVGLQKNSLFIKPPYILRRDGKKTKKPLVVVFESATCSECIQFHEQVLSDGNVRSTLEKFDIVQMDVNDSKTDVIKPDGKRTTPAGWYTRSSFTRLPALMFFNEAGELVLETDALVLNQRMMNSLNFVLERAYEKDWTYQRFARSKGIERSQKKKQREQEGRQ